MPDSSGVMLTAALLCENVLEEKDGTLTAVRIIDRVTVEVGGAMAGVELPPLPINAVLLLTFKKEAAEETNFIVSVKVKSPSGKETAISSLPVPIQPGPGKGANLVLRLGFGVKDSGLYWFTAEIDGRPVARVPLEILINKVVGGSAPSAPSTKAPAVRPRRRQSK